MLRSIGSVTFLAVFMVGCGGGGSGGGGSLATYSIGGTVTGLTGSGLVLQSNQGDVVPVSGAGATGALSPLSGSPFPLPVSHYMATDQSSSYLYVTSGANVVGYGIDATTGALTALPAFPVSAGANAHSITIDPTNQFLYVANDGAANISGFRLDALTGALTLTAGSPFPAGNHPAFIAMTF